MIARDLQLTPQAKSVLRHLQHRRTISPGEALLAHGITRLASCIHEIRNAGHTVDTEIRRDEQGHKYANYTLVKKR